MSFKRERLSDEGDNDNVNEIFDEFEDDDFIPKKDYTLIDSILYPSL